MQAKKLYRSRTDRMFAGVFGGMGEYFGVDPTLLRLGWVVVTILSAVIPGVAIYLIAMVLVPLEQASNAPSNSSEHKGNDTSPSNTSSGSQQQSDKSNDSADDQQSW